MKRFTCLLAKALTIVTTTTVFAQTADVESTYADMEKICLPFMEDTAANGAGENTVVTDELRACVDALSAYNTASISAAQDLINTFAKNPDIPEDIKKEFVLHYTQRVNDYCEADISIFYEKYDKLPAPEEEFNLNNIIYSCQYYAVGALSSHIEEMGESQPEGDKFVSQLHSNGLTPVSYVHSAMGAANCVSAALGDQISAELRQETDSAYDDEFKRCAEAMNYAFKPN